MSTPAGRPSVDKVALVIRARTKDDAGNEVGTFDDATRPTSVDVERVIDGALAYVSVRLPALTLLPSDLLDGVADAVALEAAARIEKSYWPDQVTSGKSPYEFLRSEADAALTQLAEQANAAAGGGTEYVADFASVGVGSWTSIGLTP